MPTKLPRRRTPYSELIAATPSSRTEHCWAMARGITTILQACRDNLTQRQKSLQEVAQLLAALKKEVYGHDTPAYLEDDSNAAQALHDKFMQLEKQFHELSNTPQQKEGYPCLQCGCQTDGTSEFCSFYCVDKFYH